MAEICEKKCRIIEIAERLFSRLGYEGTSMRKIAEELGSGKASLYYYFKSKEEIFLEVLEKEGAEYFEELNKSGYTSLPYPEKLRNFLRIPLVFYHRHSNILIKIFFQMHSMHLLKPRKMAGTMMEFFKERFRELLTEGMELGIIRQNLDIERLTTVYLLNMTSILFLQLPGIPVQDEKEEKTLNFEFMMQIMMKGIME
ncbi:MAG: TetR/AcrR family transcriptional regulator [Candidatus Cloacimonetes bacterium]|nr:TetR/AcrR family transcriptional regulator [Candidatus Cloacimonadota bacterium]